MGEIRVPYTGANIVQVGGQCYQLQEITTGNITHMAVDGEFSDCAECSSDLEGGNELPNCNSQIPSYPTPLSSSEASSEMSSEILYSSSSYSESSAELSN
jgi:hypothetical protein